MCTYIVNVLNTTDLFALKWLVCFKMVNFKLCEFYLNKNLNAKKKRNKALKELKTLWLGLFCEIQEVVIYFRELYFVTNLCMI